MTYSLGATGRRADSQFVVNNIAVGDTAGVLGSQQNAMRNNSQVLCRNPDGSQSYYTLDAERSLPGALVMKAV